MATGKLLSGRKHPQLKLSERNIEEAFIHRLTLIREHIKAISQAMREIAAMPDPVGRVLMATTRSNNLHIRRVATPLVLSA